MCYEMLETPTCACGAKPPKTSGLMQRISMGCGKSREIGSDGKYTGKSLNNKMIKYYNEMCGEVTQALRVDEDGSIGVYASKRLTGKWTCPVCGGKASAKVDRPSKEHKGDPSSIKRRSGKPRKK